MALVHAAIARQDTVTDDIQGTRPDAVAQGLRDCSIESPRVDHIEPACGGYMYASINNSVQNKKERGRVSPEILKDKHYV